MKTHCSLVGLKAPSYKSSRILPVAATFASGVISFDSPRQAVKHFIVALLSALSRSLLDNIDDLPLLPSDLDN